MAIEFPNLSRRYDATQRGVRFSGYDGAMVKSFFLEEEAIWCLDRLSQNNLESILYAFDCNRDQIHNVAAEVYANYDDTASIIMVEYFTKLTQSANLT